MSQVITILHLEDDAKDAELAQARLESADLACQITRVQTREGFVTALHRGGYAVILADYQLPGYDGLSALHLAREQCPEVPFIFVSGIMGEDAAIEGLTEGATDYVLKQKLSRLPSAVKRALRESENRRERQRAEAARQESEARFRQVVAAIPEHVYVSELRGEALARLVNVYQSPQVEALTGYPRQRMLDDWTFWLEQVVHPADREAAYAQVAQLRTGQASRLDYRLVRADGRVIWVRDSARVETGVAGFQTIYGIVTDITASKQAEEVLRESEEKYRDIFDNVSDALSVFDVTADRRFRFTGINPAAERLGGISSPAACGKFLEEVVRPEQVARVLPSLLRCVETGEPLHYDEEYSRPGFGPVYLNTTLIPVRSREGALSRLITISRDVTERKDFEEKLIKQTQRAQLLARLSNLINMQLSLAKVMETICLETSQALSARVAFILQYDEKEDSLKLVASTCPKDKEPFPELCLTRASYERWVTPPNTVALIPRIQEHLALPLPGLRIGEDYQTLALASLVHQVAFIGALGVAGVSGKPDFEPDDLSLLETIANQTTVAHENARLFEEKQERHQELEILARAASALRQAETPPEIAPLLLNEIVAALKAEGGLIYLLMNSGTSPSIFQQGSNPEGLLQFFFRPGSPYWEQAQSQPVWFAPLPSGPGMNSLPEGCPEENPPGQRSVVCVQLKTASDLVGLLVLAYPDLHEPTPAEQRLLTSLADMGSNALYRSGLMALLENRVADRTSELKALYDISVIASLPLGLRAILEKGLQKTMETIPAQAGTIYQMDASRNTLTLEASASRLATAPFVQSVPVTEVIRGWLGNEDEPLITPSPDTCPSPFLVPGSDYSSGVHVPLRIEGETLGLMSLMWEQPQELTVENVTLLSAVARRLAVAVQNEALHKRSEEAAVVEERHRLASELHDSVTQLLYGLTLLTNAGQAYLANNELQRLTPCLVDLGFTALQALKEMRLLLYELHASPARREGLEKALRHRLKNVEKRANLQTELLVEGTIRLCPNDQNELFLMASEALNNSLKHARAANIQVKLQSLEDRFILEVRDDGIGFDPAQLPETGMGLQNLQDRARRLGGELMISSSPGEGTCVRIGIAQTKPLSNPEENNEK